MKLSFTKRVVYLIACATPATAQIHELVPLLQATGWDVCVILTPQSQKFAQRELLTQLTHHPVRSQYKEPDDPDVLPKADALLVFPATFNTINKWAMGISDTLALGLLCEYTGQKKPILAVPVVRQGGGLDAHPAFTRSIRMLRRYGVQVLYDPITYPPRNEVPYGIIVDTLNALDVS